MTGTALGTATITATQDGVSGSAAVTVTPATATQLIVSIVFPPSAPFPPPPPTFTVPVKGELKMIASVVFSDGTTQNVTNQTDWVSSNKMVASIISSGSPKTNGRLDAKKPGTTTITATLKSVLIAGSPLQGTAIVIVTP